MPNTMRYVLRMGIVVLVVSAIYVAVHIIVCKKRGIKRNLLRDLTFCIFMVFVGMLALQTVIPPFATGGFSGFSERLITGDGINLIPLYSITRYIKHASQDMIWLNIVGNIAIFVPIGLGLPLLWRKMQRPWRTILIGFLASCSIEIIQLFIARSVDVDDILLNTLGVVAGFLLFLLAKKLIKSLDKLSL